MLTGLLTGLYCWLIGIEFPFVWGLLALVLNFVPTVGDHLAGSVAGRELAERCLTSNAESPFGNFLRDFLTEIEEEQAVLKTLLGRLDGRENPLKTAAAWLGEKAGRVKFNDRLVRYSDLSRLEELEGLVMGVRSKLAL